MLTLKAALEEATAAIGRVDAQVLVSHLLGVDRAYLIANPMRILTEAEDAKIESLVAQRQLGRPIAYLLEKREFYGRSFAVSPDVLIPRPETEVLVEAALGVVSCHPSPATCRLLDLGTGCGAIAITLACERPDLRVTATDKSEPALEIARLNAFELGRAQRIEFLRGSWYGPLGTRRYDVIVSNPPYVARSDVHLGRGDLRFEPIDALSDGSSDGLGSIRAIVNGAREHLNEGGQLLIEHGYDQGERVAQLLDRAGFGDQSSIPDLAGIPRVAKGKLE